jgi:hypothetical protein
VVDGQNAIMVLSPKGHVSGRREIVLTAIFAMLLLILLFGGLGIFVAKVFLLGLLLAVLVGALSGFSRGRI